MRNLSALHQTTVKDIKAAQTLPRIVAKLKYPAGTRPPKGPNGLPYFQANLLREGTFLRIVGSVETFLEESFVLYLTGAVGISGKPASANAQFKTMAAARKALLGGQEYLRWTDGPTVGRRASAWFKSSPYSVGVAKVPQWSEIRRIRNHIAHRNPNTRAKFVRVLNSYRQRASAKGMGPGGFLASSAAPKFPATMEDWYVAQLIDLVDYVATNP
jgi:hypothetical protein